MRFACTLRRAEVLHKTLFNDQMVYPGQIITIPAGEILPGEKIVEEIDGMVSSIQGTPLHYRILK